LFAKALLIVAKALLIVAKVLLKQGLCLKKSFV
jgi:hypothetical protein